MDYSFEFYGVAVGVSNQISVACNRSGEFQADTPRLLEASNILFGPKPKHNPSARLFYFPYAGAPGAGFRPWPADVTALDIFGSNAPGVLEAHATNSPSENEAHFVAGCRVSEWWLRKNIMSRGLRRITEQAPFRDFLPRG